MSTEIVIVNVSQQLAPLPATLQQCGAFISQGGTTLAAGTFAALTTQATLATIQPAALAVTSITWSANVATVTAAATLSRTTGDTFVTTIAGATQAGYNGTVLATVTGASTFTYPLTTNPGTSPATGTITYTRPGVGEVSSMNATWWAQLNAGNVAPFVLEVGNVEDSAAITAFQTYLTNNPNSAYVPGATGYFYNYLVPRTWANATSFYTTMVAAYNSPTARTSFWSTMTSANYTNFSLLDSCVVGLVEAPGLPLTEFSLASGFFVATNYAPSSTSKVPPLNNAFVYGVTPYPVSGTATTLNNFKAAGVNWIGTGAQGGLSLTTFVYGTTMDTVSFNWRYSIDWAQINLKVDLANAVINGSNTTINPLYYNQDGINRLQAVAGGTLNRGISAGLILGSLVLTELDPQTFQNNINAGLYLGQCVINATPFQTYLTANPSNYKLGLYGGFQAVMSPQLGFNQIVFNLEATQFV